MEFKDYYKIMGLEPNASAEDIKRTYRKLARKYHPDVSQEADAEEKFKAIGEAYEVLKDPEKRRAYDTLRTQGWQGGERFTPPPNWQQEEFVYSDGGGGFSDFFETLFGGRQRAGQWGRRSAGPMRGEDIYYRLEIDLHDAYHGATRTIEIPVTELSQGHLVQRSKTINVKIPKGVTEGQQIRLKGQGSPGFDKGSPGDLYLEIQIKARAPFHLSGNDVTVYLPVSPWEAALGGKVKAPTLGGLIEVKIPENSQTGTKLRLRGKGLPGKQQPGDQFIILQVMTPPADTEIAKDLYKQMAEKISFNPREKLGIQ